MRKPPPRTRTAGQMSPAAVCKKAPEPSMRRVPKTAQMPAGIQGHFSLRPMGIRPNTAKVAAKPRKKVAPYRMGPSISFTKSTSPASRTATPTNRDRNSGAATGNNRHRIRQQRMAKVSFCEEVTFEGGRFSGLMVRYFLGINEKDHRSRRLPSSFRRALS